jgi:Flp pilus assembly pilin Flp
MKGSKMNLFKNLRRVVSDEDGAVTVDWVVLTAAVVILAIGAIAALNGAVDTLISDIAVQMTFTNISSYF